MLPVRAMGDNDLALARWAIGLKSTEPGEPTGFMRCGRVSVVRIGCASTVPRVRADPVAEGTDPVAPEVDPAAPEVKLAA